MLALVAKSEPSRAETIGNLAVISSIFLRVPSVNREALAFLLFAALIISFVYIVHDALSVQLNSFIRWPLVTRDGGVRFFFLPILKKNFWPHPTILNDNCETKITHFDWYRSQQRNILASEPKLFISFPWRSNCFRFSILQLPKCQNITPHLAHWFIYNIVV